MDWYSRSVLSWEISVTMDDSFCGSALERALRRHGCPEIFNTDQGSQYTGAAFTGVLEDHGIRISMDGKGRAMDKSSGSLGRIYEKANGRAGSIS